MPNTIGTGREKATLRGHHSLVSSLAFARDGRTLASGSFDLHTPTAIIIWDLPTLSQRLVLRGYAKPVRAVAFHRDGRTLASVGGDDSVIIWDTHEGRRTAPVAQPDGGDRCLAFGPSGGELCSLAEPGLAALCSPIWSQARAD